MSSRLCFPVIERGRRNNKGTGPRNYHRGLCAEKQPGFPVIERGRRNTARTGRSRRFEPYDREPRTLQQKRATWPRSSHEQTRQASSRPPPPFDHGEAGKARQRHKDILEILNTLCQGIRDVRQSLQDLKNAQVDQRMRGAATEQDCGPLDAAAPTSPGT